MDENEPRGKVGVDTASSQAGWAMSDAPGVRHDEAILRAARDAARRIRQRRPLWSTRSALAFAAAASFALGVVSVLILDRAILPNRVDLAADEPLMVPVGTVTRDAGPAKAMISAEQADPELWYRYIQELVYAGDRVQAERHLRRFNQLHPDYRHKP
jgi:hypothetical protein